MLIVWASLRHAHEKDGDPILQCVSSSFLRNGKKCRHPCSSQDILIISTNCEHCGYRDNEVKSGSVIFDHGRKIILKVKDQDDLSRDIPKVILNHYPFRASLNVQLQLRAKLVDCMFQR